MLFAVDRAGIFAKVKESERGVKGAYCTVCNRTPSEDDAEIGEKTKRTTQKGYKTLNPELVKCVSYFA
ncbi:hypothetical protein FACS189487_01430 [Campylobacterota bacterium]|nr:hypothetical protein FACS189487_01430 [Campylobacterota bacterium]